jgi:predicted ATPase/class 3 adenylate cyclase
MPDLPSGTVTFLFTDVEGSTRLLHDLGAEAYAEALAEHRRVIRAACAGEGGVEVDTQGDAFFFAFPTAPGAVRAAAAMSSALASGPIQVRVGLHTGTPLLTDEGYVGEDVHRAARIGAGGHGGQVLVSSSTKALVGSSGSEPQSLPLLDLGEHRFKDLSAPERVYQLGDGSFPPLKTLYQTNLPVPSTPFLGRERELQEAMALLARDGVRLLTLTGPGGTGKTRLGLQVAGAVADGFPHGVWWVPLASLDDPELVLESASRELEAKVDLDRHIGDKQMLLLFDNFEHVAAAAGGVAALLEACPRLEILVTSRERLHLTGEHEYPVPPLAPDEAVDFFAARARASSPAFEVDDATGEICRRLDDLPLALELAAARVKALSTDEILRRLERRLPLLTGGGRDAPARQQTLRATIGWSYDLLSNGEQTLFTRLAVFAGGCTLEAAEHVCEADVDTLQSLVEKSLVRFTDDRYWMLETIREYAAEQLSATGETGVLLERLGRYLVSRAEADGAPLFLYRQPEAFGFFEREHSNTRAVMEWSLSYGRPELAAALVGSLGQVWSGRGHLREAAGWIDAVLRARGATTDRAWAWVLISASDIRKVQGDVAGAVEVCEELVRMADNPSIDRLPVASALADLSDFARDRGDHTSAADYAKRSLEYRTAHDLPAARAVNSLAEIALANGDLEQAERLFQRAADDYAGHDTNRVAVLARLGEVARRCGDLGRAANRLGEALETAARLEDDAAVGEVLQAFALLENDRARPERAATLWAAGERLQDEWGVSVAQRTYRNLDLSELPRDAMAAGAAMDVDEAVAYALSSGD